MNEEFVITSIDESITMLNEMSKKLAEIKAENEKLQEQLKNSICPKFKVDDKVWIIAEVMETIEKCEHCGSKKVICVKKPIQVRVQYFCWYGDKGLQYTLFNDKTKTQYCYYECYEVFATQEEAEQKLKELGEKK